MSDTSWLYGGDAPESEAVQAEREIVEDIVRTAPTITAVEVDFDTGLPLAQVKAERALDRVSGANNLGLAERVETAGREACDNCHFEGDLFYNEVTGLSLCEGCDQAATTAVEAPQGTVRWTKLRSGAWGLSGPSSMLVSGARVPVTKRSGEVTHQTVGRVLWSGDGKAIATARK